LINIYALLTLRICGPVFCLHTHEFYFGLRKYISSAKGFRGQVRLGNTALEFVIHPSSVRS